MPQVKLGEADIYYEDFGSGRMQSFPEVELLNAHPAWNSSGASVFVVYGSNQKLDLARVDIVPDIHLEIGFRPYASFAGNNELLRHVRPDPDLSPYALCQLVPAIGGLAAIPRCRFEEELPARRP